MIKNYINKHTEKLILIIAVIILFLAFFLAKAASEDLSAENDTSISKESRSELEELQKKETKDEKNTTGN